jgi:phosphatidylserine decarboxylase
MKAYEIYNRGKNQLESECSQNIDGVAFLYNTIIGKALTNIILNKRVVSVIYSKYINSSSSVSQIAKFIKQYDNIISEVKSPIDSFQSLNDFFIRELMPDARLIDPESGQECMP